MAKQRRRTPRYQREAEKQSRAAAEAAKAKNRVPVDSTQMVIPANSYFSPPAVYDDVEFTCRDCARREVWPAADQKWWYEVAKGSIYASPHLCEVCRMAQRDRHQGTPRKSHAERRIEGNS